LSERFFRSHKLLIVSTKAFAIEKLGFVETRIIDI
jgi:hypothetical protein